jgi:hypothetical protein
MRNKLMFGITVIMTGLLALVLYTMVSKSPQNTGIPHDRKHDVVLRCDCTDSELPADGQLLIVKRSLEDTLVVGPATDDDCRRVLEEHGKG